MRGAVDGEPFGMVVLEENMPDVTTSVWLAQLRTGADWNGAVVLVHDGGDGPPPAGVNAMIGRDEAAGPAWAELLGRHYPS
jgi:hypothetical protein